MKTVTKPIRFESRGRRKRALVGAVPEPARRAAMGRVPRVARLMALAIRFDQLLRDGVVANQTELARLARVSQPRMTQIMNLLHLAPDIQEDLVFLGHTQSGGGRINERSLRAVVRSENWRRQRDLWHAMKKFSAKNSCHTRTH